MTTLHLNVHLAARRDEVWAVVGDFGRLDAWHPLVPKCELQPDGVTRLIRAGGTTVVEVLDPEATVPDAYTYTVKRSPIPARDYRATISIFDEGPKGCSVAYQSSFKPASGVPEPLVRFFLRGFFTLAFWSLKRRFGAQR